MTSEQRRELIQAAYTLSDPTLDRTLRENELVAYVESLMAVEDPPRDSEEEFQQWFAATNEIRVKDLRLKAVAWKAWKNALLNDAKKIAQEPAGEDATPRTPLHEKLLKLALKWDSDSVPKQPRTDRYEMGVDDARLECAEQLRAALAASTPRTRSDSANKRG